MQLCSQKDNFEKYIFKEWIKANQFDQFNLYEFFSCLHQIALIRILSISQTTKLSLSRKARTFSICLISLRFLDALEKVPSPHISVYELREICLGKNK